MNRLILKRTDIDQKTFILEVGVSNNDVITHLNDVLKVKINDIIKASFLGEGLGLVKVNSIGTRIELEIVGEIQEAQNKELHLLIGVSRPPTVKKILEHGTTLGVSHFHFFKAELSDKSYLQSKVLANESINKLLRLGVSQSSQLSRLPIVTISPSLEAAVELTTENRFLLSLKASQYLGHFDLPQEPITLAIGPERGWTEREEEFLERKKFLPVKISSHTLRVETAAFTALGQLEMLNNLP